METNWGTIRNMILAAWKKILFRLRKSDGVTGPRNKEGAELSIAKTYKNFQRKIIGI